MRILLESLVDALPIRTQCPHTVNGRDADYTQTHIRANIRGNLGLTLKEKIKQNKVFVEHS